jgi:hypothetical protein
MVFGKIVCTIVCSLFPVYMELSLTYAIAYSVKAHVCGFRPALFDIVIDYVLSTGVFCLNGGCRWGMAHFKECGAQHAAILAVVIGGAGFCFHGRAHDVSHEVA